MFRLQGLEGVNAGATFSFSGEVVAGRSSSCDLVINDPCCSRRHARIEPSAVGYRVRDLSSRNGLTVNGKRVLEAPLQSGDILKIGSNAFLFLPEASRQTGDAPGALEECIEIAAVQQRVTQELSSAAELLQREATSISQEELGVLKRSHRHLDVIRKIHGQLGRTLELDALLETIESSVFDMLDRADRVSILLAPRSGEGTLEQVRSSCRRGCSNAPISRSVLDLVQKGRRAIRSGDASSDARFDASESVHIQRLRSFLCVPMLVGPRLLGAIYAESTAAIHAFASAELELLAIVGSQAAAALGNALAYESVQRSLYETVRTLGNALEAKDPYTRGHSDRVARYAVGIAKRLGIDEAQTQVVWMAAQLHDIGKIAIEGTIIGKNGRLTDEEYTRIKKHPEMGVKILEPVEFLRPALPLVLHHHERYDGTGYPAALRGTAIPLGARIINLADAFDAMTTQRSYNKPVSFVEAMATCQGASRESFDPGCVDALMRHLEQGQEADSTVAMSLAFREN